MFAVKEKCSLPVMRNRSQPSRFGYRSPEAKEQQTELHHILRSTGAQAKLTIGQPNDKYEQEADRVADQVVRMSDADVAQRGETETIQPMKIQRIYSECEEELAEPKPGEEEEMLQAKEMPGQVPKVGSNLEARINNLKGSGHALDSATRSYFEPRFGYDFSGVRINTNIDAATIAQSVRAKAFTFGNNIILNSGHYSRNNQDGKKLLAHELTHVIQQNYMLSDSTGILQRQDDDEVWAQDSDGSLYYDTESEAMTHLEVLKQKGGWGEYRVVQFEQNGRSYWRVEMRNASDFQSSEKDVTSPGTTSDVKSVGLSCPVQSKGTLSKVSWGETSGIYPTSKNKYFPEKWDKPESVTNHLATPF